MCKKFKTVDFNISSHPLYNKMGYLPLDAGWVYVVRFGNEVKIGKTNCPVTRMDTLQYQKQVSLDEVHLIVCDDARRAERGLHYKLNSYRLHGEWFRLSHIQMEVLRTIQEFKNGQFVTQ